MTVTVVPRTESGAFRDTTLVYLDGGIDAGAPERLSRALHGVDGRIAVWLNSPGGNLFAGMQLGRIIRERGARTHIIDSRTLLPGECYSACAVAFLGGVYRFDQNGGRYGVHRASLVVERETGDVDLAYHLTAAIESYVREMGVDRRLLDLWMKARPDEMYVLSRQETRDLRVANNGRLAPQWTRSTFPGGTQLQGRQATAEGTAQVFFSCGSKGTVFGAIHDAAGQDMPPGEARGWRHVLTIDGDEEIPVTALGMTRRDGVIRPTFSVSRALVRRAMTARQVGHRMTASGDRSRSRDVAVDIDDRSAGMVRTFLRDCLTS